MTKYIIEGPSQLNGTFHVGGSKNAVLPILAASLLFDEPVFLENVPDIADVKILLNILQGFGAKTNYTNRSCQLNCADVHYKIIDRDQAGKMRASILFMGASLSRFGQVKIAVPGGDIIGARPLNTHFEALAQAGVLIKRDNGTISAENKPKAADITLRELSVTATENIILATVRAKGTTLIRLAAVEPHVIALCEFLNSGGAQIEGLGTHTLKITGVERLHSTHYKIPPDYIEAGTVAIAAAATRGTVVVDGFVEHDNDALLQIFKQIGVQYEVISSNQLKVSPSMHLQSTNIRTDVYPGFPSDQQAPLAVLLTQANGTSEVFETLYEGRLNYFYQLERMGANVSIRDTHTGVITGPTPLYGADVISIDVRAGATMVVAALLAEGTSTLDNVEHIDRGYARFDERLNGLGANIKRLD